MTSPAKSPSAEVAEAIVFIKSLAELPYGKDLQHIAAMLGRLDADNQLLTKHLARSQTAEAEVLRFSRENAELRVLLNEDVDQLERSAIAQEAKGFERGVLAAKKIVSKRVEAGEDDGYTESDTNAFIWTNKEAEWVSICCEEMADEINALLPATQEPGAKEPK